MLRSRLHSSPQSSSDVAWEKANIHDNVNTNANANTDARVNTDGNAEGDANENAADPNANSDRKSPLKSGGKPASLKKFDDFRDRLPKFCSFFPCMKRSQKQGHLPANSVCAFNVSNRP